MPIANIYHIADREWENDPQYAYVGRTGHGHDGYFGNPYRQGAKCLRCGSVHHGVGQTLVCYAEYLRERVNQDAEFRRRVKELHGKTLVCFCAPKTCHANLLEIMAKELFLAENVI
jgi:hypothetical protein